MSLRGQAALFRFRRLAILVSNAGIGRFALLLQTDPAMWEKPLTAGERGRVLRPAGVAAAALYAVAQPARAFAETSIFEPARGEP